MVKKNEAAETAAPKARKQTNSVGDVGIQHPTENHSEWMTHVRRVVISQPANAGSSRENDTWGSHFRIARFRYMDRS